MEFSVDLAKDLILCVAKENNYKCDIRGVNTFEVYVDKRVHAVHYWIQVVNKEYLTVYLWQTEAEEYKNAVFTLKQYTDVVQFCTILISSKQIRAMRRTTRG